MIVSLLLMGQVMMMVVEIVKLTESRDEKDSRDQEPMCQLVPTGKDVCTMKIIWDFLQALKGLSFLLN